MTDDSAILSPPDTLQTERWAHHAEVHALEQRISDAVQADMADLEVRVMSLDRAMATLGGRDSGISISWGVIIGITGMIVAILALALRLAGL